MRTGFAGYCSAADAAAGTNAQANATNAILFMPTSFSDDCVMPIN
jgi:hypothetical protein